VACLGDVVGFVVPSFGYFAERDASACLELIRRNCKYIVAGNHDLSAAGKVPVHTAGFDYPDDWYEMDYADKKLLVDDKVWLNEEVEMPSLLSKEQKAFVASLPEYQVMQAEDCNILLSHYLYPDLSGSSVQHYEAFGPVAPHFEFMDRHGCLLSFSGHMHVEGVYLATPIGNRFHEFGKVNLDREPQWIVGPCVANGKKENGCMVFNTETFRLRSIPLKTPPRVMIAKDYNQLNIDE
jgi:hypothetical protein